MPVDEVDIAKLRQIHAEAGDADTGDELRALQTHAEVFGYLTAVARQQGADEADWLELLVRAADISKEDVRGAERLLRRLGYTKVCDRLRELAKRARRKPPPYCWQRPRQAPSSFKY